MKRSFSPEIEWTSNKKPNIEEKEYFPDDIIWEKQKSNSIGIKSSVVSVEKNIIYFNGKVSLDSVLDLRKAIKKINDKYDEINNNSLIRNFEPEPIYLKITSYGGSVIAAMSAIDNIRNSKVPIYTVVDGCAASAATLMSIVGKKRFITPSSYMLIHQLSSGMCGKHSELKDDFKNCETMMSDIKNLYIQYTNLTKNKLNNFLKHDIWWKTDECLKFNLVDEIFENNNI